MGSEMCIRDSRQTVVLQTGDGRGRRKLRFSAGWRCLELRFSRLLRLLRFLDYLVSAFKTTDPTTTPSHLPDAAGQLPKFPAQQVLGKARIAALQTQDPIKPRTQLQVPRRLKHRRAPASRRVGSVPSKASRRALVRADRAWRRALRGRGVQLQPGLPCF